MMIEIVQVGHESEDYFLVHDPNTNDCPCGNSADLIALRDVLNKKYPVNNWQPVPATWEYAETKDGFVWTSTITSERNGTHLTIEHTDGDEFERSVDLPDGYALCRLVTP